MTVPSKNQQVLIIGYERLRTVMQVNGAFNSALALLTSINAASNWHTACKLLQFPTRPHDDMLSYQGLRLVLLSAMKVGPSSD